MGLDEYKTVRTNFDFVILCTQLDICSRPDAHSLRRVNLQYFQNNCCSCFIVNLACLFNFSCVACGPANAIYGLIYIKDSLVSLFPDGFD